MNHLQATGGANFNSFAEFANTITCAGVSGAVTVDVVAGSGPYIEQVVFGSIPGSSATNTISINGNGNTLTYTGTAASPYTLGLNGSDYISVSNLNVVGLNTTNVIAGHLWNGANNNTFTNCSFSVPLSVTAFNSSAFSISSAAAFPNSASNPTGFAGKNNTLQSCTASGGYYCVIIDGSSSNTDSNNQVINCTISDFERLGLTSDYNFNLLARGNTIERLNRTSLGNDYVGMLIAVGCAGSTIEKNIFRNPFANDTINIQSATGIQCSASGLAAFENKFYNNLIYNFKNNGIQTAFNMFGADYYSIYHNTISLDYTTIVTETTHGIYCSGNTGSKKIRNNIVSIKRAGTGLKTCLYFAVTGGTLISNNNLLYVVSGGNIGYRINYSTTLAQWQADPGGTFDAQSISVDPIFSSPSTGNYYPTNSLSDNKGAPVGILNDLIGVTRSTLAPDVGVYEYTLCTNMNGGSISPGSFAKCVGQTYTITATGVSVGSGITLQWQLANTLGGTYTDIPGASNSTYIPSASTGGIYYYRLKTTCSLNVANPVFSNEFIFTVNALPVVTVTPSIASICIPYISPISLQASGGVTYTWTPATSLSTTTGANVNSTSQTAIIYTVTATNANGCSNTNTASLVSYPRPVVAVSSSSNNICRGNSIQLNSQSLCYKDVLRITEITQSKTGLGATATYPSYIVSGPDDFIEISNISNMPINAQGLVIEMWAGSVLYRSFTLPTGTIIPANGVAVFANGIGTNSISNRYFFMEPQVSANLGYNASIGYVLRQFGLVIDAVGVYGYNFPVASGVSSADWSGSLTSTAGAAGLIRSAAIDNNTASNWSFSSASLLQTIGTYNSVSYTLPTATCNYNYLWSATNPSNSFSVTPPVTPSINVVCQQNDTYTLSTTGDGGCLSTNSTTVNVSSCPTPLQLKLFIQGYYKSSSNMRPVLFNDGLSTDATDCDSIVVFLHEMQSPYQIVDSVHTIMQTNGSAICHFTDRVGLFYISVRSRNAVETWSSMPFQVSNNGSLYDFTSTSSQAYGNNMKQVENGVWAFYSGDINADGNIDNTDYVLLMNDIDDFTFGYQTSDLDGDGNVDLLDLPVLEQNLIQFISSEFPN